MKYFQCIHHKLFLLINYYIMYNASLDCILLLLLQRVDSLVVLSLRCKLKPWGEELRGMEGKKESFNPLKIQLCRDQRVGSVI